MCIVYLLTVFDSLLINEDELSSFQNVSSVPDDFWDRRMGYIKELCDWVGPPVEKFSPGNEYWNNEGFDVKKNYPYSNIISRKPGKKAVPNIDGKVIRPGDINFALMVGNKEKRDFEFRHLWIPLVANTNKKLVKNIVIVIYRMGYMLDYKKNSKGLWRLSLPDEVIKYFSGFKIKIKSKGEKKVEFIDVGVVDYLNYVDCLFMDEELFYFRQTKKWFELAKDKGMTSAKYSPLNWNEGNKTTWFTKWKIGRITCSRAFCEMFNAREKLGEGTTLEQKAEYLFDYNQAMRNEKGMEKKLKERTGGEWNPVIADCIEKDEKYKVYS